MAFDDEIDGQPDGNWPQVRSGPLVVGGILIGIGAVVAMAGAAVAGAHLVAATRAWISELETPPAELARLKWEQAKTAVASGHRHLAGPPERQDRPGPPGLVGLIRRGRAGLRPSARRS